MEIKGKPKLPDFTTKREKDLRQRNKIYYLVAIIFAILTVGGIVIGGLNQDNANIMGLILIYEGVVFLGFFLFHIITWKRFGWEQMSTHEFEIHKLTQIENNERKKEGELELIILDFIVCITGIVFLIIGFIKLF